MRASKDVLIVDDDAAIREMVCAALQGEKLTCDTAADGHDALDLLAKTDYAVILLDLKMPSMDGFGVLNTIREWEKFQQSGTVVLVMTATDRDVFPTLGENVQAVIRKPFAISELADIVRSCVNIRRAHVSRA